MSKNKVSKPVQSIENRLSDYQENLFDYLYSFSAKPSYQRRNLELSDMIDFKTVLSDVNNIITLLMTREFVRLLGGDTHSVDNNPNANGYDLVYQSEKYQMVIAEVKSTIPCLKNKLFGPKQIDGIIKDIEGLKEKKNKSQLKNDKEFEAAVKVMILLDREDVRNAINDLKKKKEKLPEIIIETIDNNEFIKLYKSKKLLTNQIYVVFVSINNNNNF